VKRRWTPEEDAYLRQACARKARVPRSRIAAALGRTEWAISVRLNRLGIQRRGRSWSPTEDATLRRLWPEVALRVMRQHLPGRTSCAIRRRATDLGLSVADRSQGLVTLTVAAERAGYHHRSLVALLLRHGVRTTRVAMHGRAGVTRPQRWVEWEDVVAAVAADTRLESATDAARRLGVPRSTFHRHLRAAGYASAQGHPYRLAPEVYDQLVRAA
jgi:hypothetical protein